MKSKNIILLKTLLLSTSLSNISKYSTDKKKKGRSVAGFFGMLILFAMLIIYSSLGCIGLGVTGYISIVPTICAVTVSSIAFVFTFFKTNGYLFNFKEYDMLMALPFKVKDIAMCRFFYMYVKSLPWYAVVSLTMMVCYGIFSKAAFWIYPLWICLALFIPIIPMLIASFIGFLIAKVSSGFEKKNTIQTVLTLIFVMFCFSLSYIIEAVAKNNSGVDIAVAFDEFNKKVDAYYFPAALFSKAITLVGECKIAGLLYAVLFVAVSVLLLMAVFAIVGKNYRKINSALKSHVARKDYKLSGQKKKSVLNTLAYKEFRRFMGSTNYCVNVGVGVVMALIAGIAVLIVGFDKVVYVVTKGAPIPTDILHPAIPLFVYFLVGMLSSVASSPSLEGKNYWIVQSLPLEKKTIYQGKMLFNMYLTVPAVVFGILCFCISAKVPLINAVLYLVLGLVLCAFSTTFGCVCGIKFMRLDWENEIEVIKQGAAVCSYMFTNMLFTMGLMVLVVWLGTVTNANIVTICLILVECILTSVCYTLVLKLAK
ncbi:ABC-2 type transport system permease protein [Butyrivibrio hungatei DSM 14810]|uniref:ABC-2 type transport system permease protein n=1 Tax=Butyrivibrio hungatei DSM 14810 TaxID=1121132 RepID=A0A1M7S7M4_9FIRM|nr:hypothetical protein [Butyrivibrio hungatei]SHN54471.1 ABC-2 type transport system permease protein [Butyrivibrio hungatei DSM 14810]